jgi:hypothetical protein
MRKIFILTFILASLVSCSKTRNSTDGNNLEQDINKTITLAAPSQLNVLRANGFIGLVVQNNSEDKIALSFDYGVTVMALKENKWKDVLTIKDAYISPVVLSPKSGAGDNSTLIDIAFRMQVQEPTVFRFKVKGVNQSTNREAYAYIDLTLLP